MKMKTAGVALWAGLGMLGSVALADESAWPTRLSLAEADAAPAAPAEQEQQAPAAADPFAAGTWVTPTYFSVTVGRSSHLYEIHAGVGYYFLNDLSLNLEGVGNYTSFSGHNGAPGGTTWAAGFDLLVRYHFLKGDGWSIYADAGAGMRQFMPSSFPADGTHFEFTPQAGLGGTLRLLENLNLMGGARWFHASNAGIHGSANNPGYDSLQVYLGAMIVW